MPRYFADVASVGRETQEDPMPTQRAVTQPYPEASASGSNDAVAVPESAASSVSWSAIFAGAAAAAGLSLILLILGTGLGLSSVSPWSNNGISATTFGVGTILWITLTQVLASGMGGYLSGRLRTRWVAVHADEVHFRDTAHGFLAWAVATLATAALLTSVIGSIVGGGVQAGASLAGGMAKGVASAAGAVASGTDAAKSDADGGPLGYFVDSLFRPAPPASADGAGGAPAASSARGDAQRAADSPAPVEIARIFTNSIRTGNLPAEDVRYVGQQVAQRTGMTQAEAERRVTETYAKAQATLHQAETTAKEAADKARKASAYAALWLFISLLMGAFVASFAAT
ncbi:MAG TPA: hypothetical protein VM369_11115, partial [Candidatus Binatia bacterium]|nr:hypothetical protein [Candidatus Binatia bacterium]